MTFLLVDDEAPARARLRFLLEDLGHTDVLEAASVRDAVPLLPRADGVLLDIQMPLMDGFDLVSLLPEPRIPVIFVTAYAEYAVKAFDVRAVDYLTKPVRKERLAEALARLTQVRPVPALRTTLGRITVERAHTWHVLDVDACPVFYAEDRLVFVRHGGMAHRVNATLDELEERLDPAQFLRIHRGTLVNLQHVQRIYPWFAGAWKVVLTDGTEWEVARRRAGALKERLGVG